jgi:acyl carrier protein
MSNFKTQIRDWILAKNPKVDGAVLTDDAPLLEKKILTSIQIMDLILYLEHLQGRPVDIDQVQPENFHSLNTIHAAFFAAAG